MIPNMINEIRPEMDKKPPMLAKKTLSETIISKSTMPTEKCHNTSSKTGDKKQINNIKQLIQLKYVNRLYNIKLLNFVMINEPVLPIANKHKSNRRPNG